MHRRDFIKKSVGAGLAASASLSLLNYKNLFGGTLKAENYDLVAAKGAEPDVMFDKAIAELGGMKKFVKKGQTVVVKPNIGWDVIPENAANTNPLLVKRVIEHCYNAGAKTVYVFDHTCDYWKKCYSNSGIEKAANDAGAKVVSGDNESYYHDVELPKAKKLKKAKIHELILDSDVFINVPILKHHFAGRLTVSMKNLMGIVWDRGEWHRNDLHQCIADCATFRKPDLNIVDAYNVMKRNGPRGISKDDLVNLKGLIISKDILAADTAAIKLYGMNPEEIEYMKMAEALKVGDMNLDKLSIKRLKLG